MRTCAITSGKGGVGKTSVSANLGIALAAAGNRVLLFDADLTLANLDVILGCTPEHTLADVVSGRMELKDVLVHGPGGIKLLAGGSGVGLMMQAGPKRLGRLFDQLEQIEGTTDFLFFDTGAGVDQKIRYFLKAADETLLIATPDPASILDAYAATKILYKMRPDANVRIVANMVHGEEQARMIFGSILGICRRFLGKEPSYVGSIRFDARFSQCVRRREPAVLAMPELAPCRDIVALAKLLASKLPAASGEGFVSRLRPAVEESEAASEDSEAA